MIGDSDMLGAFGRRTRRRKKPGVKRKPFVRAPGRMFANRGIFGRIRAATPSSFNWGGGGGGSIAQAVQQAAAKVGTPMFGRPAPVSAATSEAAETAADDLTNEGTPADEQLAPDAPEADVEEGEEADEGDNEDLSDEANAFADALEDASSPTRSVPSSNPFGARSTGGMLAKIVKKMGGGSGAAGAEAPSGAGGSPGLLDKWRSLSTGKKLLAVGGVLATGLVIFKIYKAARGGGSTKSRAA